MLGLYPLGARPLASTLDESANIIILTTTGVGAECGGAASTHFICGSCCPASPVYVEDSFWDTPGTSLLAHKADIGTWSAGSFFAIGTDNTYCTQTNGSTVFAWMDCGQSNYTASAFLNTGSTPTVQGIVVRVLNSTNYYAVLVDPANSAFRIVSVLGNFTTQLAFDLFSFAADTTYQITVLVEGNNIIASINGETSISTTSATSFNTSTLVGFNEVGNGSNATFSTWCVTYPVNEITGFGGGSCGGSATLRYIAHYIASGGAECAGINAFLPVYPYTTSGIGAKAGGSAHFTYISGLTPKGGAEAAGSATLKSFYKNQGVTFGGGKAAGAAFIRTIRRYHTSGGAECGNPIFSNGYAVRETVILPINGSNQTAFPYLFSLAVPGYTPKGVFCTDVSNNPLPSQLVYSQPGMMWVAVRTNLSSTTTTTIEVYWK
jgi:hypothetical protein